MKDNGFVLRALVAGVLLAIAGIGAFLLMYFVVFANAEALSRLMGSLIVPPLLIALIVGGYALMRPKNSDAS